MILRQNTEVLDTILKSSFIDLFTLNDGWLLVLQWLA